MKESVLFLGSASMSDLNPQSPCKLVQASDTELYTYIEMIELMPLGLGRPEVRRI
jgi:hypothetical protein